MLSFFLFKNSEVSVWGYFYLAAHVYPHSSVLHPLMFSCVFFFTPLSFDVRTQLIDRFQLDEVKLAHFLMRVEDGYPMNPYHNRIHAADVLQSLNVLLCRGGLMQSEYCDEVSLLSCYLSAASTMDSWHPMGLHNTHRR